MNKKIMIKLINNNLANKKCDFFRLLKLTSKSLFTVNLLKKDNIIFSMNKHINVDWIPGFKV